MTITDDLKIFSLIYEYRFFVIIPLCIIWLLGSFYFLLRLKRVFFLWLLLLPIFILPLNIAATWCGWHYRMELYDRFAKTPQGWHDIDYMPPKIRAEYARHDYHPRHRDIITMVLGTIVFTPILYGAGGLVFVVVLFIQNWLRGKQNAQKED